jgi:hypothetical protein
MALPKHLSTSRGQFLRRPIQTSQGEIKGLSQDEIDWLSRKISKWTIYFTNYDKGRQEATFLLFSTAIPVVCEYTIGSLESPSLLFSIDELGPTSIHLYQPFSAIDLHYADGMAVLEDRATSSMLRLSFNARRLESGKYNSPTGDYFDSVQSLLRWREIWSGRCFAMDNWRLRSIMQRNQFRF